MLHHDQHGQTLVCAQASLLSAHHLQQLPLYCPERNQAMGMLCACLLQAIHWEEQLPEVALKEGGMLLADEQPTFAMRWRSIEEFWQVT